MRTKFIEEYFQELKKRDIGYCIPRGYTEIFSETEKDIDVMISPRSYGVAAKLFSQFVFELGGFVIEINLKEKSLYLKAIFHNGEDGESFQGIYIHAVGYMTAKKIYACRKLKYMGHRIWLDDIDTIEQKVGNAKVVTPEPTCELYLLLVRYQQRQKQRYLDRCRELFDLATVQSSLKKYRLHSQFECFFDGTSDDERLKRVYLLVTNLRASLFQPVDLGRNWCDFWTLAIHNLNTFFHVSGKLIFFSGPDGSGKTTANQALSDLFRKKLKMQVLNTKHLYPVSNKFSSEGQQLQARIRGVDKKNKSLLERDRGHGFRWRFRRGLGLVFLLLQVFPGYCWAKYKNWKGYTVVIDTSFFDMFIKGHRPVFAWIELFSVSLLPCGDAWFLLKANPDAIVARKPELTVAEIEKYYLRLDDISRKSSCTPKVIQSDKGVDVAIEGMLKVLALDRD